MSKVEIVKVLVKGTDEATETLAMNYTFFQKGVKLARVPHLSRDKQVIFEEQANPIFQIYHFLFKPKPLNHLAVIE